MKLSKNQISKHESALRLLDKDYLTYDEKLQVYKDWIPAYSENIGVIASYFTPHNMARDMCLEISGNKIIDLCSGIGMLAFTYHHWQNDKTDIVCIERNRSFVEVGKNFFLKQNGEFAERQMLVPPITEPGCIWFLTPTASDCNRDKLSFPMFTRRHHRSAGSLPEQLYRIFGGIHGRVNPQFYAWMMGFPLNWLDNPCMPTAML